MRGGVGEFERLLRPQNAQDVDAAAHDATRLPKTSTRACPRRRRNCPTRRHALASDVDTSVKGATHLPKTRRTCSRGRHACPRRRHACSRRDSISHDIKFHCRCKSNISLDCCYSKFIYHIIRFICAIPSFVSPIPVSRKEILITTIHKF